MRIRKEAFDSTTGILSKAEDSVIILRKWYGHWLLGTTDTPYDGDNSNPAAIAGGATPIILPNGQVVMTGIANEWAAKLGGGYRLTDWLVGGQRLGPRRLVVPVPAVLDAERVEVVVAAAEQR